MAERLETSLGYTQKRTLGRPDIQLEKLTSTKTNFPPRRRTLETYKDAERANRQDVGRTLRLARFSLL